MADPYYHALLEACNEPGCPVCRLRRSAVERFLEGLFYESVNDAGVRADLRHSMGFCKAHARLILETPLRDALGLTIIYHDLLQGVLASLPEIQTQMEQTGPRGALRGRRDRILSRQVTKSLTPQGRCLACAQEEQTETALIHALLEHLSEPALSEALGASAGLCLPHLRLAVSECRTNDQFNRLMSLSRLKMQGLLDELSEFLRKSDYRFMDEGFGEEGNAYQRCMELFTGKI